MATATAIILMITGCSVPNISLTSGSASQAAALTNNTAASNISANSATVKTFNQSSEAAIAPAKTTSAQTQADTPAQPGPVVSGDFTSAVRNVATKVKPAVVQITNQQVQLDQNNQSYSVPAGVGSGVIYDKQGHILTNNHVIEGAQDLLVSLPDGRSVPATLIGADPQTDLAVLQIKGDNLPVAELGDSTQLQVGDWLVAIGNALALPGGPTVTAGVASALGRTVQEPSDSNGSAPFLFDVVQTSAPINPGNSGGPLVNLAGQVVGINTLVAGMAEPGVPSQGIGFAISIAAAKPIADELVANGHATHTYLGIRYTALTPSVAARLGITQKNGIVVMSVVTGSPAAKAGLQRQDIITSADGSAITDESGLARTLSTHKAGDKVTLIVMRGTQERTITVTLAEMAQ